MKIPPSRANWMAPVMPFQKEVWAVLFVTVFIVKLLPYFLKWLGNSRYHVYHANGLLQISLD